MLPQMQGIDVCSAVFTHKTGWPQFWKTWNTRGLLWMRKTWQSPGNSVQFQGKDCNK